MIASCHHHLALIHHSISNQVRCHMFEMPQTTHSTCASVHHTTNLQHSAKFETGRSQYKKKLQRESGVMHVAAA